MAEAAGAVNRAQQGHQNRQGANGVKAIGVRRQAAHGVEGHRIALDALMLLPPPVRPGNRQFDFLVAGHHPHLMRDALDGGSGNAGNAFRPFRRALGHALLQQLKGRLDRRAICQGKTTKQGWISAFGMIGHRLATMTIPPHKIVRTQRVDDVAVRITHHHAKLVAIGILIHQLATIGVARHEFAVIQAQRNHLADNRHDQRSIGAGFDGNPLIGNRRIAGTHRINRHKAPAVAFELAQRRLHGVGVMVFRRANHKEQLGTLQVGATKLPERAADGVNHARRHVDRAETAVRRVVRRTKLARKQAGQRLHLVASGEQGKFFRVSGTQMAQPAFHHAKGFIPGNRLILIRPALGADLALQRLRQARRRILLHDARRAFGTQNPLVQGVVGIAFDVAHLAIAQMHPNATTAGAHVTGGSFNFGGRIWIRRGDGVVYWRGHEYGLPFKKY